MFNLFKRAPKPIPNWQVMESYPKKNYYFYRLMPWGWLDKASIFVSDTNYPRMITMEPWPQIVYLNADGTRTIIEFAQWIAGQYSSKVPDTLTAEIIELMEAMSKEDCLIELSEQKKMLAPNLVEPITK